MNECIIDAIAQQKIESQIVSVLQRFAGAPNDPSVKDVRTMALLRAVAMEESKVASHKSHYNNSAAWQEDKRYAVTQLSIVRLQSQVERANGDGSMNSFHWAADQGDGSMKPRNYWSTT